MSNSGQKNTPAVLWVFIHSPQLCLNKGCIKNITYKCATQPQLNNISAADSQKNVFSTYSLQKSDQHVTVK